MSSLAFDWSVISLPPAVADSAISRATAVAGPAGNLFPLLASDAALDGPLADKTHDGGALRKM
jgi:hypothetical protein